MQYGTIEARGESQAAHNNIATTSSTSGKPFKNPHAIEWAERQEIKKTSIKLTLLTTAGHANQEMVCVLRQETIATKASQSERTVQRNIAALRWMGLILVRFGSDASSVSRRRSRFWRNKPSPDYRPTVVRLPAI
jgi:hypothetical protein